MEGYNGEGGEEQQRRWKIVEEFYEDRQRRWMRTAMEVERDSSGDAEGRQRRWR